MKDTDGLGFSSSGDQVGTPRLLLLLRLFLPPPGPALWRPSELRSSPSVPEYREIEERSCRPLSMPFLGASNEVPGRH